MKISRITFISLFICAATVQAPAQNRHPVDTVPGSDKGTDIVLMSDHTWEYMIQGATADSDSLYWMDRVDIPFRTPLASIPDTVILDLADSMGIFAAPYIGIPSSHYGMRWRRRHTGTDIPLNVGDQVLAAFDGVVSRAERVGGYGNLVVVRHINGMETYYAHLSSIQVVPGEWVTAGQIIGLGGNTGHSTGPHLHFETRYLGFAFDAERLIDFTTGELRTDCFKLLKSYFGSDSRYGFDDLPYDALALNAPADSKEAAQQASAQSARQAAAKKAAKATSKKVYHKVKEGDNLSRIAHKYHTTVGQICSLNKISEKKPIRPGQSLRVK